MGFLEAESVAHCKCNANKKAVFPYTFKEHFGNHVNKKDTDVLILLEFKELKAREDLFNKLCKFHFKDVKYTIIPALGCTPIDFSSSSIVSNYSYCKEKNIKKIIDFYNPKTIITTGRAIYSITESKDFQANHFFIPVNESLQDYQIDDSWFYSSEFGCKIFPIPAMYQWLENSIKDVYEYKFSLAQFQRAKDSITEVLRPERKCQLVYEENPNEFIEKLINDTSIKALSLDSESSGLNYFEDILYSLQISINSVYGHFLKFEDIDRSLLVKLFDRKDIIFVMHNGQHDIRFLKTHDVLNARCDFDTMLASHILNENNPNGLKPCTWLYTRLGGYELDLKRYMKKYKITDFTKLPKDLLLEYSCYDAIATYRLFEYFDKRFKLEDSFVEENFYNFVMPAVEMIVEIEMTGVQVDMPYLYKYVDNLKERAKAIEEEIYEIAGYEFNIKSSKEMSVVLKNIKGFKVLKDDKGKELLAKNGDLLLNKQVLERYFNECDLPFIKKISEYNHISKEISQLGFQPEKIESTEQYSLFDVEEEDETNEKGFLASMHNGRLHGGYKLHGTETGRMAGGGGLKSTVNWQNMPATLEFRKMFLPSEGCVMAFADYDAMEVCIFSQVSGPGVLEDVILDGKDMHCFTMVKLFEMLDKVATYEEIVSKTKVDGQEDYEFVEWRKKSKSLNFQCLYGATAYGVANIFGVTKEEGQKFLDAFYQSYPEVAIYMEEYRDHAKTHGWVKTLLGRKRRLPQLTYIGKGSFYNKYNSTFDLGNLLNAAINAPIQGVSGQTTLIAMTNIWKEFTKRKLKSKVLINVHDEIVFEIFIPELEEVSIIVKEQMEKPYYENVNGNRVELTGDIKYGETWKYGYGKKYWDEHPEEWLQCIKILEERNIKNKEFSI